MVRRRRSGMTLIEVTAGIFVTMLGVLAAGATFSSSLVARDRSGTHSRAAALIQRKLEQIRRLPASQVDYAGLRAAGIIDEASASPYPFTEVDELAKELPQGVGTVTLTDPGTELVKVEVVIQWRAARGMLNRVGSASYLASREIWVMP